MKPAAVLAISKQAKVQIVKHYLIVFASAFLTVVGAGAIHVHSVPTLKALIWTGFGAGVAAIVNILKATDPGVVTLTFPVKLKSAFYTIWTTSLVTFVSLFGAALVTGASSLTSYPKLFDLLTTALASAVAGVVSYFATFIPPLKKPANQSQGVFGDPGEFMHK